MNLNLIKLLKVENKVTVVKYCFASVPNTLPYSLFEILVWIYTFINIYNKEDAPKWSKGYSKGSLQGKRIIITLEFSEFYDTIGPGRNDYPVHKANFIYIPKKMSVDGAVSFIRKYSSKIQQQNSKTKLFFGNTHFYFLHSLTIVIPKDPQDPQNG